MHSSGCRISKEIDIRSDLIRGQAVLAYPVPDRLTGGNQNTSGMVMIVDYEHTQRAPLHLLLHVLAAGMLVGAWASFTSAPFVTVILSIVGIVFVLLGLMFAHLSVCDEGESLAVRFGPLRLFGTRISYAEISSVQSARSAWIDGFGIHAIPGRGWTFNLWGFDCVELIVAGRVVRIGTDDVENLLQFLQSRITVDAQK